MNEVITSPIFGIMVSILAYLMGMLIFRRFPHPITTPLLLATFFIITFLKISNISYTDYYVGGSYLNSRTWNTALSVIPPNETSHQKHSIRHFNRLYC